jgi:hypothetical protein
VVTLISDAAMVSADPVVVSRAGAAYLDVRAVCPRGGAFHPKLFVLTGEEGTRVAIGSGNLTMAGWHGNAELLTVLRGDRDGGPRTIHEVADFLERVAAPPIVLGPGADKALERVAARLREVPAADPGPRLLHNLDTPIVEALPETSAQELVCSAPYFDRELRALGRLFDRFSPARLSVLVEEDTRVDGPQLLEFLQRHRGELRWIEKSDQFHHGKLIEWSVDDKRWALTGSPNLSGLALLEPVGNGGNCELALLAEVPASIAPANEPPPEEQALRLEAVPEEEESATAVVLLAAIVKAGAVHLRLHAPLLEAGVVQSYDQGDDGWHEVAGIEGGRDSYVIGRERAAVGQALRLLLAGGASSNPVFVTDLRRALEPQRTAVGRLRLSIEEVAAEGLWPELLADIDELRPHLLAVGALVPAASERTDGDGDRQPDESPAARPDPGQDLEAYLVACDPVLGREATRFALALPTIAGLGGDFGFDAALEDDLGAEAAEQVEAADREENDLSQVLAELPEKERIRARRWIARLVAKAPGLPMIARTLALRCVLHGIAREMWTGEEAEEILLRATEVLAAPGDQPTEDERVAAGSLAAIAAVWMRQRVGRLSVRDEAALRYERIGAAVRPLLPFRAAERIEALAVGMPEQELGVGWVDACSAVAEELLEPANGSARAVQLLEEEYDLEAEVAADGSIELLSQVPPRAEPCVCLALGLGGDDGPLKVNGRLPNGTAVTAVWSAPFLIVEKQGQRRWGSLYRLPKTLSPFHYAGYDRQLPKAEASWSGEDPRPRVADELLASA